MNKIKYITVAALLSILLLHYPAFASGWRVIPIRLDFDQRARSGVITLINDSEEKISFSILANQWSQDVNGKDVYTPTSDIIFFPKALTVNPGEERVIRAGIKIPPAKQEKAYRLFIKEEPTATEKSGTAVAIAIRFGIPIFASPPQVDIRGEIAQAALVDGRLDLTVRNSGNAHFRLSTIRVAGTDGVGEEIFSQELTGWYSLADSVRSYTIEIPGETCRQLKTLEIKGNSDRLQLSGIINVEQAMCPSQ